MSDRDRVSATAGTTSQNGVADSGSGQAGGPDSASGTPTWVRKALDPLQGTHARPLEHEEPVPYELTVEAEQALDEPWSGEPLADWEKELLRPEWEQQVSSFCFELGKLIIRKRRAYGTEAIDDGPYGWTVQLITRIHEKYSRIVNLASAPADLEGAEFEPLAETFMDLAGLSVLAWIKAKNEQ